MSLINKKEAIDELEEVEDAAAPSTGVCGILGRYPVVSVLLFAATGVAVGIGLSFWEPDNDEDKDTAIKWLGLIGDMFIRSLKAVVLPLVFVNVILSVVDMMSVGRASAVGAKTILYYLFTTVVASVVGIVAIVIFKGLFLTKDIPGNSQTRVQLGCSGENGFLSHDTTDGSVVCIANLTEDMSSYFTITDVDGTFVHKSSGPADLTFSDTIYDGVFKKMIPSNVFESVCFYDTMLLPNIRPANLVLESTDLLFLSPFFLSSVCGSQFRCDCLFCHLYGSCSSSIPHQARQEHSRF